MDQNISKIRSILSELLSQTWPELKLTPEVLPHYNLEHGDLFSSICLDISAALKLPLTDVGSIFKRRLQNESDWLCNYKEGFLNFSLSNAHVSSSALYEKNKKNGVQRSYDIVVTPALEDINGAAQIRICALGLMQALMLKHLGSDVSLWIGEREISLKNGVASIFREFINTEQSLSSRAQVKYIVERMLLRKREVRFWGDAQYWEGKGYSTETMARHIFVEKRLIDGIDISITPEMFEDEDLEFTWAWILYLCGPTAGIDLDSSVPRLKAAENMKWFLHAVTQRLDRYCSTSSSKVREFIPSQISSIKRRNLLIHLSSLPAINRRFVEEGEITQGLTIWKDLLESVNQELSLVKRDEQIVPGHFNSEQHLIFDGAKHAVSAMIGELSLPNLL